MKYKVLKEFIDPRIRELMKPGDTIEFLYDDDVSSYRGAMIRHGFIEEVKVEPWEPKEG